MQKRSLISFLTLLLIFFIVFSLFFYINASHQTIQKQNNIPVPSSNDTQRRILTPSNEGGENIIGQIPSWVPDLHWQDPRSKIGDNGNGQPVSGMLRIGNGVSETELFSDIPRIHEELKRRGWQTTGPGDSPGFSSYIYTNQVDGKRLVIILTYKTKAAIVGHEPIRFANCPCPYELTVFISNPF